MATLSAGQQTTIFVPAGYEMDIPASVGATGSIVRIGNGVEPGSPVVYAGSALQFGPYEVGASFRLECYTGSFVFDITPAVGAEQFGDPASQAQLRQLAAAPFEAIVFSSQIYAQVLGDLNKIKCGTTGASDATFNLLAAASAGDGAVQQVMKDDSAAGRLIVKAAGVALGLCVVQGEILTFVVRGGAWMLAHSGSPMLIGRSNLAVANVAASTGENILATIPIPAGLLGLNKSLSIDVTFGNITNNANVKTYRARLGGIGGTTIATAPLTSAASGRHVGIVSNRNAANAQVANVGGSGIGTTTIAIITGTIDTTVDQDLVLTMQHATGSDVSNLERYRVDLLH